MVSRAVLKYLRVTPRKFRQVIPLVKGKNPEDAVLILMTVKKNAAKYAIDLIKSAIANAKRKQANIDELIISYMVANPGPMLKRFRAASMGRASSIRKHTSHIIVELDVKAREANAPASEVAATESKKPVKRTATVKVPAEAKAPHVKKAHKQEPAKKV